MWKLKSFLLYFISSVSFFQTVIADCSITTRDQKPLFIKNFGSKKVFLTNYKNEVLLESGETIQAHCGGSISLKSDRSVYFENTQGVRAVELYCRDSTLSYTRIGNAPNWNIMDTYTNYVSCDASAQQFYESNKELPNCKEYSSYALGFANSEQNNTVTAGICYDLEKQNLKYITYLSHRPKFYFLEQKINGTNSNMLQVQLDIKLTGLKTLFHFMRGETFNKSYETLQSENPLLQLFHFGYASLLQETTLENELYDYKEMFQIIWWQNLRLGNWNLYLNLFKRRAENTTYLIYTGTSGVLKIPTAACDYEKELVIQTEGNILKAPTYIWTYLKSPKEEFVIIASNSPFYKADEINFCKDICHEINWLNKSLFNRTHLIPTMGLMHCCHPSEVANKLENFPIDKDATQTVPFITTTTGNSMPKAITMTLATKSNS